MTDITLRGIIAVDDVNTWLVDHFALDVNTGWTVLNDDRWSGWRTDRRWCTFVDHPSLPRWKG